MAYQTILKYAAKERGTTIHLVTLNADRTRKALCGVPTPEHGWRFAPRDRPAWPIGICKRCRHSRMTPLSCNGR